MVRISVENAVNSNHNSAELSGSLANSYDVVRLSKVSSESVSSESLIAPWVENLLRHFGINELQSISDQTLLSLLSRLSQDPGNIHDNIREDHTSVAQVSSQDSLFQDSVFLAHLKHRITALAGAQLDATFLAMSPDVIEEEETEPISLKIDSRLLQGVRYQGEVYRLVEKFAPCHRLQAFCLGHTLNEQLIAHIITQSSERFAVWVNVRALPHTRYHSYLP